MTAGAGARRRSSTAGAAGAVLGLSPAEVGALRRTCSAWAARAQRDLPWRGTRDPWGVLVSELMLQQTQVARVVDRWPKFLARFPTPAVCAAAPVGEVIAAWAGLGYNRRAVNLHRCAVVVVAEHDGALPSDLAALLRLPGIGPYTARAVAAFAFEADVGVLDTNVGRVLARVAGRPLAPAEAQAAADGLVPRRRGWAWNQGMLDLGAMVCTARAPRCDTCPIARRCAWRRAGNPEPDPARGSAAVAGGQSRFAGSDRQGRGRLVAALAAGAVVPPDELATVMGWPDDPARARRVADGVLRDGLAAARPDGALTLP
ncbi:MAG: A/G-specific adenine glycosylase [Acidimicrobiales bacterium]